MTSSTSPQRSHPSATTILRNFLNQFLYELENDEPIQGSDAVDAIRDLYEQVQRHNTIHRRPAARSTTRRTAFKRSHPA